MNFPMQSRSIKYRFRILITEFIHFVNLFVTSNKKTDIIITRMDALGDFLVWLDSMVQIRQFYQGKNITLICSGSNQQLAEKSGLFDRIVVIDPKRKKTWFHMIGLKAEIVLNPITYLAFYQWMTIKAIVAKEKISIAALSGYQGLEEKRFKKAFTKIIPVPYDHYPENYRSQLFANAITGYKCDKTHLADISFMLTEQFFDIPYFCVNLGASNIKRMWPFERFLAVSDFLYEKTGWLCVLIGSPSEVSLSEQFERTYSHPIRVMTGKTDCSEMITLINNAKLLVGNDTGTLHVAAACQTPCICVSPVATYESFTNYRMGYIEDAKILPFTIIADKCPLGYPSCCSCSEENLPFACLRSISSENVCKVIEETVLANKS